MDWKKGIIYNWKFFGESIIRNVLETNYIEAGDETITNIYQNIADWLDEVGQECSNNIEYYIGKSICFELRELGYFVNAYTICSLTSKFISELKGANAIKMQA